MENPIKMDELGGPPLFDSPEYAANHQGQLVTAQNVKLAKLFIQGSRCSMGWG